MFSLNSFLLLLHLSDVVIITGSQIYRPGYVLDLRISLSPYQIPAFRGHDDDRPFHNSVFGIDSEYTELEV